MKKSSPLDGVFVEQPDGPPRFEQLPELRSVDVAELVTVIRIRVLRLLARRGVIEDAEELCLLPTELAERVPACSTTAGCASPSSAPSPTERPRRLLERLGEPTEVAPRAPARGPPYFKTPVLRRRFGGQEAQREMFDDGSR